MLCDSHSGHLFKYSFNKIPPKFYAIIHSELYTRIQSPANIVIMCTSVISNMPDNSTHNPNVTESIFI